MNRADRDWVREQVERGIAEAEKFAGSAVAIATYKAVIVGRCGFCGSSVEAGAMGMHPSTYNLESKEPRCQKCKAVVRDALPMLDRRSETRPA